jgi:hypothetical protein
MLRNSLIFLLPLTLSACPREQALTGAEAREAVQQASLSSQSDGVAATSIDIATNFTIGQGVEAAAEELRQFVGSQLPCARVSLEQATLTVQYGANPGSCAYRGHTFSGTHSITLSKNEMAEVEVHHVWDKLSNGRVEVDGVADVTWSFANKSRHVVHSATWRDLRSGVSGQGSGDRLQRVLEGGLEEGIRVDGSLSWTGAKGNWDLGIDGVELRWVDPVPQAGTYTLRTPADKTATLSFSRLNASTIHVTVSTGKRDFEFNVTALGLIQ